MSVKSSKIVAGQEPEKTNELLQCLALALDQNLSSEEAVKKIKENSNAPEVTKAKISTKSTRKNVPNALSSKNSEKLTSKRDHIEKSITKLEKDKSNENKTKKKENEQFKQAKPHPSKTSAPKESLFQQSKLGSKGSLTQKKTGSKSTISVNSQKKDLNSLITENLNESVSSDTTTFRDSGLVSPNKDVKSEVNLELNNDLNETEKLNSSYKLSDSELNSVSSTHNQESENNTTDTNTDKKENLFQSDNISFENNLFQIESNENASSNLETNESNADIKIVPQIEQTTNDLIQPVPLEVTSTTTTAQNKPNVIRPGTVRPSSSRPGAPRLRDKLDNIISEPNNALLGKVHIISENNGNEEVRMVRILWIDF